MNTVFSGKERKDLLALAAGFGSLALGLPLTLLLFFNTLQIQLWRHHLLPSYIFGVLIMGYGLYRLHGSAALLRHARRQWRRAAACCLLLLYFAPFVGWWRRMPTHPWMFMNMLLLLFSVLWLLILAVQLVDRLAAGCNLNELKGEARWIGWSVALMLAIPLLAVFPAAGLLALRSGLSLPAAALSLVHRWPRLLTAFFLVPFSLVVALLWKTRNLCLQILAGIAGTPGNADG